MYMETRVWLKFKLSCLFLGICYPEESYFPTLMNLLDTKGCVRATLTYVDWTGSNDSHPRMFEKDEIGPQLISALRMMMVNDMIRFCLRKSFFGLIGSFDGHSRSRNL
ncbi:hypothetical protein Ahy_B08g089385 [Arachis hypogaea]|uniref:Uncharacterized protein n=1 Tax=Arachis hypogaea TaxID=3818 RepID=A0A444XXF9_ARAHY|nr:hypothetical protein Ahy_B08g089385 [Arachis hypogaea]